MKETSPLRKRKEENVLHWRIDGNVQPKERPRKGKYGNFYTPAKTKKYEQWVKMSFMSVYEPVRDADHEWEVDIEINYKGRRPDLDNCMKGILDGLNNVLWVDDKQVRSLKGTLNKVDDHPCVYVKAFHYKEE